MYKLLVEYPNGNQQLIEVEESGSYYDSSRVKWDERINGPFPEDFELGKMVVSNGQLLKHDDYIPGYAEIAAAKNLEIYNKNVAALWAAADAYIYATINGAGWAILAVGVREQKPKAKAVAAWCDSIWTEYYTRVAMIQPNVDPNLDYSGFGDKPYTILELREEVADLWITP